MGYRVPMEYTRSTAIYTVKEELEEQKDKIIFPKLDQLNSVLEKIGLEIQSESPLGEYLSETEYESLLENVEKINNGNLAVLLSKLKPLYGYYYVIEN